MTNILLSGGSGTRLWPLSRELMPKQFLKLFDGESLFQKTLQRNKTFCDKTLIVTGEEHYFLALDQCEEVGYESELFMLESVGRDAAAAIMLAALSVDEDEILFVTPSDHLIEDMERYEEAVLRAKELAEEGAIVTFGIIPIKPETGYGYIEAKGEDVVAFHEKPDIDRAIEYLQKGYFWNSGMFMFKASTILEEMKRFEPSIYEAAYLAFQDRRERERTIRIPKVAMEAIQKKSIDYAVMERSKRIKMVPGAFAWSDVGSFDALSHHLPSDENLAIDSKNTFVKSHKKVVTIGVEDLIVVDTPDALLIAKKGESQKVREAVARLKEEGSELVRLHTLVHRPWGSYEVLIEEERYKIKRIVVKPGKRLSLQKHFHRSEHWVVVSGTAKVQVGDREFLVQANESTYIKMGEVHRLSNPGKLPVVLIEAQVGEYVGEDDIVRIEDDFEREDS